MDPQSHVPSPHNYALSGKIMLSSIIILFTVVLLILFLHFYVRWHVLRRALRRSRRRRRRFIFSPESQSPSSNKPLDPSLLKSLPVLLFSPGSEPDSDLDYFDCAICLNEFEDGQKIRNLPICAHTFHVDCIDMWFSSHSNCPLCRATVKSVNDLCLGDEDVGSSSSDSGSGEVVIGVSEGGIEGFGGDEERLGLGLGQALKWPINRIVLLRRFFGEGVASNAPAV